MPVFRWIRRSDQPIRPKAMTCCFFSSCLLYTSFHATLNCALALAGCDGLRQIPGPADEPSRYSIPALDRQAGSGWIVTTDTLRAKRQKDQNIFEWRREAPVRPVVFRDPNKVTDEVVQLHLEHPVVQRLLQRFLSQGFVHDDLSRTCVAQSRDSVPRVAVSYTHLDVYKRQHLRSKRARYAPTS